MHLKKVLVLLIFASFLFTGNNVPQGPVNIKINLFNSLSVSQLMLSHNRGSYKIYGDGSVVKTLGDSEYTNVSKNGGNLSLSINGNHIGTYKEIRFVGKDFSNSLKLKCLYPKSQIRIYEDDFRLRVDGGKFKILNEPELNHYIAGVVESEVGKNAHLEYYKLQSILCRTYALSNMRKHENENFHLCDEVCCQVYKGKSVSNRDILKATAATTGLVLIDNDLNLITATFHSNCGGHTVNSEDVWSLPLDYLRGVRDTFCTSEPHANWKKSIAKNDWESYLVKKYNFPVHNDNLNHWVVDYKQAERDVFYTPQNIPLKTVRKDWGLNSTYFSITHENDSVHFMGRGFGHGVGLCQEGAMNMAKQGYSYKSILSHYYKNVNLVNLRALRFITEE